VSGFHDALAGVAEHVRYRLGLSYFDGEVCVSFSATSETSWTPLPDEELTWFRAAQKCFAAPQPLNYTAEIHALVFGLTYALESLEFPLYALRSRLFNGRVYLAAVPSVMAESNLPQRLKNIHAQSVRFTRNIGRAWERQLKPEVDLYNRRFEEAATLAGAAKLAEKLWPLRRDRGNQWFTLIRGVIAPSVLVQLHVDEVGQDIADLGRDLTRQALELVAVQGKALLCSALTRAGKCLVGADVIDKAEDVYYLEWKEVIASLEEPQNRRELIAARLAQAARDAGAPAPEDLGPVLTADAPRMYLIREILDRLDS
jgi:hypothetical protein